MALFAGEGIKRLLQYLSRASQPHLSRFYAVGYAEWILQNAVPAAAAVQEIKALDEFNAWENRHKVWSEGEESAA
eukprot:5511946-Amphidinium_carterae.1